MPSPVSTTLKVAASSPPSASTATRPPGDVWRRALSRRLVGTWTTRPCRQHRRQDLGHRASQLHTLLLEKWEHSFDG